MNSIEEVLKTLGLKEKDRLVYQTIAENGKIAPARISRLTKINRTTVYSITSELKRKGLIREGVGDKVTYWSVANDADLDRVITRERETLAKKEETVQTLKEVLKNMPSSKTFSIPKIRYIEEDELDSYLYEATPKWEESLGKTDPTWWGFQDHTFVEHFEKWIDWYWRRAPKEFDLKLFSNDSTIEKHMVEKQFTKRQIRFWDEKTDFTGTLWITGDYVTMIQTNERPFYLVEIHDRVLAHNMREVFRRLWGTN